MDKFVKRTIILHNYFAHLLCGFITKVRHGKKEILSSFKVGWIWYNFTTFTFRGQVEDSFPQNRNYLVIKLHLMRNLKNT